MASDKAFDTSLRWRKGGCGGPTEHRRQPVEPPAQSERTAPDGLVCRAMPRRSLRPELNRIRGWVRQGRTDAWIAHQLEVTVQQIQAFKREQALGPSDDSEAAVAMADFDDEIDLRAEDDALVAAELDAAAEARAKAEAEAPPEESDDEEKPKRRRTRRTGTRTTRGKRKAGSPLEATFDHGEEGY